MIFYSKAFQYMRYKKVFHDEKFKNNVFRHDKTSKSQKKKKKKIYDVSDLV